MNQIITKTACFVLFSITVLLSRGKAEEKSLILAEHLNLDYYGCTISNSTIVAYGSACTITISKDDGKTWARKPLGALDEKILKMKNYNSTLVAYTSLKRLLLSEDGGNTWKSTTGNTIDALKDVAIDENGTYICGKNTVYFLDNSMTILDSINTENDEPMSITTANNTLYITGNLGTIWLFNSSKRQFIKKIDFKALQLCTTCSAPTNLIVDGNAIYARLDSSIIKSVNGGTDWSILVSDLRNFYASNNELFTFRSSSTNGAISPYYIECAKYDGSVFQSISDNMMEYFTFMPIMTDWKFKGKDTIVAVGYNNAIVMSTNRGVSWKVISNLDANYGKWISKNDGVIIGNNGRRLYHTTNGGVTWMPLQYPGDFPSPYNKYSKLYYDSTGFGYANNMLSGQSNKDYWIITKDFWKTYQVKQINKLSVDVVPTSVFYISDKYVLFNTIKQNSKSYLKHYILDSSFSFIDTTTTLTNYNIIDIQRGRGDTLKAWLFLEGGNPKIIRNYSIDMGLSWVTEKEYHSRIPKFDNIRIFGDTMLFVNNVAFFNGTKFDATTSIYSFIISKGEWVKDTTSDSQVEAYTTVSLGRSYYVFVGSYIPQTPYVLKSNSLSHQPNSWVKDTSFAQLGLTGLQGEFPPNIAYFGGALNGTSRNIFRLTVDTTSPSGVENTEEKRNVISTFPPYPNPATREVRTPIFWDQSIEFSTKRCAVYSALGEKIEQNENMTLRKLDSYHGEILWDCSHVGSGVYYIYLQHGNSRTVVPVIVYQY